MSSALKYYYADNGCIEYRHKKKLVAIIPLWRAHLIDESKYTGAKLREIRKRNGVGRPPRRK